MRALILATLFATVTTGAALADQSVAGTWRADMGSGIAINMDVSPDGSWSSETYQKKEVVREMKGTYTQTQSNDHSGVMVFTPTQATTQNGKVQKETDRYEIAKGGNELKLTTGGDTMIFEKQAKP